MVVCLVMNLRASNLAIWPIVANSSIHCLIVASLTRVGGMAVFFRIYNCWMSWWLS